MASRVELVPIGIPVKELEKPPVTAPKIQQFVSLNPGETSPGTAKINSFHDHSQIE